jgi:hypothetical protein
MPPCSIHKFLPITTYPSKFYRFVTYTIEKINCTTSPHCHRVGNISNFQSTQFVHDELGLVFSVNLNVGLGIITLTSPPIIRNLLMLHLRVMTSIVNCMTIGQKSFKNLMTHVTLISWRNQQYIFMKTWRMAMASNF